MTDKDEQKFDKELEKRLRNINKNENKKKGTGPITELPVDDSEYGLSEKAVFETASQSGRVGDQVQMDSPSSDYGAVGKSQLKDIIKASKKKAKKD